MNKLWVGAAGAAMLTMSGWANAGAVLPPTLTKSYSATTLYVNQTTTATYVVTNPNVGAVTGLTVTDPLSPGGLEVAATPAETNTCGGVLTATPGGNIQLTGGNVGSGTNCDFSVQVTGTAAGTYNQAVTFGGSTGVGTAVSPLMTVLAAVVSAASIPTLSEWGIGLLVLAIAASAFQSVRRTRT